ncbi:MAG: hypothetical protein H7Y00_01290 [Fimbriimonadaceae bacterium]|nr:hypothetical protein [Chitinophagales bacterium]
MKKIFTSFTVIILFHFGVYSQNSGGVYTGINMTFPDFESDNFDKAEIGTQIGFYDAYKKNNFEISFRASVILRSSHLYFYNGGLGAGTTYDVDVKSYSFQPGLFPAIYFGQNKHFYVNAGIAPNFTIYRHFKGDYISHFLFETEEGKVDRRDTIYFKDFKLDYLLGFGYNNIKLKNKMAFVELSSSHTFENEFSENRGYYIYKPIVFYLVFGLKLF